MKTKEKATVSPKKKGKKALKVIGIILAVIVILVGIAAVANVMGNKGNIEKIAAFESAAKENQLVPEKDENGNPVVVGNGEENFNISLKQLKEKAITAMPLLTAWKMA